MEYVLELIALKKELDVLRAENKLLKDTLSIAWTEDVCNIRRRSVSDAERARWKYYHENKNEIMSNMAKELGIPVDAISWRLIKKQTDKAYDEMNLKR